MITRSQAVGAALAVCAAVAVAGCRDIQRSNCDVEPADFNSANYARHFSVFHEIPRRCPLDVTDNVRTTPYLADIYADPNTVEWGLNNSFYTALRGYQAAYSRGYNFFYDQGTGNLHAQVAGEYAPALNGCAFNAIRQADYARVTVPLKGFWSTIAAEVILSYRYLSTRCGGAGGNASWMPNEPVTAYAIPPSDPAWQEPTTYAWALNGSPLDGETGSTVTRSGFGPGQSVYYEVTMSDAAGHSVYSAFGGQIRSYGSCDPTVMTCNDQ